MIGTAYGARLATAGFQGGQPRFDVATEDGLRLLVVSEEPYASHIAEAIAEAREWDELPEIEFELYQVVGEGR